ncbi:MAG TPA: hypothetical protein ENJ09_02615 [Planctomycetes bacterium]|nr:hypothetical protein [Planctomycetota bacterium]
MREGIHPEVLQLFAEILGDDEATLTRISRMRPRRAFPERVSVGTPFLSTRERYLVEWHREEVAFVLHQGCRLALQESCPVESRTTFEDPPVDRRMWERERARALAVPHEDTARARQALRSDHRPGSFRSDWARLALALAPRDEIRVDLACALAAEERWEEAETSANGILDTCRSAYLRSAAFSVLGNCAYQQGRPDYALQAYRQSALEADPAPAGPLFWLAHAIRAADTAMIQTAAQRILALDEIPMEVVISFTEILRSEVESGRWLATPIQVPATLGKHLRKPVREMIDAITIQE